MLGGLLVCFEETFIKFHSVKKKKIICKKSTKTNETSKKIHNNTINHFSKGRKREFSFLNKLKQEMLHYYFQIFITISRHFTSFLAIIQDRKMTR